MEWYLISQTNTKETAKQNGKTINLYGKERGLVTDDLVLDKVFEGKYSSWAAFKKAMYKERVDQFENLKQVTFKDPTNHGQAMRQRPSIR